MHLKFDFSGLWFRSDNRPAISNKSGLSNILRLIG